MPSGERWPLIRAVQWILADAHGGADPEADAGLVAVLDQALARGVDLLILGDLFAVWGGPQRFLTPFQAEIIAKLRALRRAGHTVRFVVGNRDYLVRQGQHGPDGAFDAVIEHEAVIDVGGLSTLVTHGDNLNPKDRRYLMWRRVSRNPVADRLLLSLPSRFAQRMALRMESAMRTSNQAYKTGALPYEALEALSRRAARRGAQRALIGHFHADQTLNVPGGVPLTIAPAWLDHRRILMVQPSGALSSVDPLA